ncbi:MAG: RNA polymerase sigma factor [Lachnospiraceae bacterium]|nr:RNA polymerase sigma factor [Lachnospiraceae bacterium]
MYYDESDETIYSRFLAEKDENDLLILIERYRESLTLFLNGFVNNMGDAEELMMDAFAEAAAGPTLFSSKSSFKTWLFSIGKKLALMHIRKTKRFVPAASAFRNDKESLRKDKPEEELPDEKKPSPELEILKSEQNRLLYEAMAGLNDEYRRILILLYFEGMSHEEAEQVMGKSRRQVYHLAERSRSALKEQLKRMGFEYEEL